MKKNRIILGVFLLSTMLFAKVDTLRLQQGVNGYSGMTNAYLMGFKSNSESNVHTGDTLWLHRHC